MSKCKLIDELNRAHDITHHCSAALDEKDLKRVEAVKEKIIEVVNGFGEQGYVDGVRFLGVMEALRIGVAHMEEEYKEQLAEASREPGAH